MAAKQNGMRIWFRHSGEADVEGEDWACDNSRLQLYTIEQVLAQLGDNHITHLSLHVNGIIPCDLHTWVPHLTHLSLLVSAFPQSLLDSSFSQLNKMERFYIYPASSSWATRTTPTQVEKHYCNVYSLLNYLGIGASSFLYLANATYQLDFTLPDAVASFRCLQVLSLERCKLKTLPSSLASLQIDELRLSMNDFSLGVPEVVFSLKSLKVLSMNCCYLKDLQQSLSQLHQLHTLSLKFNFFEKCPQCICSLPRLQVLDLAHNRSLLSLCAEMEHMTCLKEVNVTGCTWLSSPPLTVCGQGVAAIRSYYNDSCDGVTRQVGAATVVVLGLPEAGKTSLISTLQDEDGRRVLTNRSSDDVYDQSTKVFNVKTVGTDGQPLRIVDVGGHEVYHMTYQLTLKEKCVPVVVVNMEQFKKLCENRDVGDFEAVRRTFFDWMSHFYLAAPGLGNPKLVFTHKDKFSVSEFVALKERFLSKSHQVKNDMLAELQVLTGPAVNLMQISHTVFQSEDIFEIGNREDEGDVFQRLKDSLVAMCAGFVHYIPKKWEVIEEAIGNCDQPFQWFRSVADCQPSGCKINSVQLESILVYMHDAGKLLWYKAIESLHPFIFPDIAAVTKLLEVVFNHTSKVPWAQHQKDLGEGMALLKVDPEVESFRETGIVSYTLLHHLISSMTPFQTDMDVSVALSMLKAFYLIHGPFKHRGQISYALPYFSEGYQDEALPESDKKINLRLDVVFKGLSLPRHVYDQMTVALLELYPDDTDTPFLKHNGATIYRGDFLVRFTHAVLARRAVIEISTEVEGIGHAWAQLLSIWDRMSKRFTASWSASYHQCVMRCAHCHLKGAEHPKKRKPTWTPEIKPVLGSAVETVRCGQEDVPLALILPCKQPTKNEVKALKTYLKQTKKAREVSDDQTEAAASPAQRDRTCDDLSDLSDGDGYFDPRDEPGKIFISLKLQKTYSPAIKALYVNTDKVYKMSSPLRGRALIINNLNFKQRPDLKREGSEVDVKNLKKLFKELRFKVISLSDLSAKDMMSAVEEEAANPAHADLGMFTLVIMSHGLEKEGVYGADMKSVQLTDIYHLLGPLNFTAMAGKPKFIIIQACSGFQRDCGDLVVGAALTPPAGTQSAATDGVTGFQLVADTGSDTKAANSENDAATNVNHLNVSDMLIIKSAFESYIAVRHKDFGSLFVRCLVTTFYKHACSRDVFTLCEIVQQRVYKESIKLLKDYPRHASGQMPMPSKTFTHYRKLYLFPGYNGPRSG